MIKEKEYNHEKKNNNKRNQFAPTSSDKYTPSGELKII